jgi:hypothetical protein
MERKTDGVYFSFSEVVGEFRTMDSVGNMIWESRSDLLIPQVRPAHKYPIS